MEFFWVNQGASHDVERQGKFLWAPNNPSKPFKHWTNVAQLEVGDIVFCNNNNLVKYIATVTFASVSDKPIPMTLAGGDWDGIGFYAEVEYFEVPSPQIAKSLFQIKHLQVALASSTPKLISTIGTATQTYLCSLSNQAGISLLAELGFDAGNGVVPPTVTRTGRAIVPATTSQALVKIRKGQQRFRTDVLASFSGQCAITGIKFPDLLRASHIKPWAVASDAERLDCDNGLALTPNLDILFDRGFIAFDENGEILISQFVDDAVVTALGLIGVRIPQQFQTERRKNFLSFHRDHIFLKTNSI